MPEDDRYDAGMTQHQKKRPVTSDAMASPLVRVPVGGTKAGAPGAGYAAPG